MKQLFFITGTGTGVGKTVFTALLAAFLREGGVRIAALKPICSGGRSDAVALRKAMGGTLTLDKINPWHFRAPIAPLLAARREKKAVKLADVVAHARAVRKEFDVVLVEGAGGLLSPLGEDFNSRDLLLALRAIPLIVAANRLGVVNNVLLTLEALPKRSRARAKVILMAQERPDSAAASNAELLSDFLELERIVEFPWLGGRFLTSSVLRRRSVRAGLAAAVLNKK
jgi:dethiobiotin synthetase